MPDTPMTETEKAVQRLIDAIQSFSATVKSATEAFDSVMPSIKELGRLAGGVAMLEAENAELRRQRDELRREVKRLSALADAPRPA